MSLRVLAAYSASSTYVATTLDHLTALQRYSGLDVAYIHITHDAVIDVDPDVVDVVFHNYCARLCFEGYVSESYRAFMRAFGGLKVLTIQDEYEQTNVLKAAIKDLGFHVVLTCVPPHSLEMVFPRAEFPQVRFEKTLTGFMPEHLVERGVKTPPLAERPTVVGYRARALPPYYGRLGQEKIIIGLRMAAECEARGVPHDISLHEDKRIYGDAWFGFIASCRAMVGSETGCNLFDWDGSLKKTYNRMVEERSGAPVGYDEFIAVVGDREQTVFMGEISPRIFESAVMRTAMVLHPGNYSGAIEADTHYIPLAKDFSNIDEVLARLADLPAVEAMTQRAYDHLVDSGKFGYRAFALRLRGLFEEECALRGKKPCEVQAETHRFSFKGVEETTTAETPTREPQSLADFERKSKARTLGTYLRAIRDLTQVFRGNLVSYARETERVGSTIRETHAAAAVQDSELDRLVEAFDLDARCVAIAGAARVRIDSMSKLADSVHSEVERMHRERIASDRRVILTLELQDAVRAELDTGISDMLAAHDAFTSLMSRANALVTMAEARRVASILGQEIDRFAMTGAAQAELAATERAKMGAIENQFRRCPLENIASSSCSAAEVEAIISETSFYLRAINAQLSAFNVARASSAAGA